jgi:hypothetical protein
MVVYNSVPCLIFVNFADDVSASLLLFCNIFLYFACIF